MKADPRPHATQRALLRPCDAAKDGSRPGFYHPRSSVGIRLKLLAQEFRSRPRTMPPNLFYPSNLLLQELFSSLDNIPLLLAAQASLTHAMQTEAKATT